MPAPATRIDTLDLTALAERIKSEARRLGFQAVHIGPANTEAHRPAYEAWLAGGYNGETAWSARRPAPGHRARHFGAARLPA